jgi:hypothetical protein
LYRAQTYEKRIELFAKATEFCASDALTQAKSRLAVTRAKQLRVLQAQLEAYRRQIETLFAQHPDHDLFGSLPGTGPKLAPRLLAELGEDRARFESPQDLQCNAGTAPVSYQSGPIHKVYVRWHCNKALRHTVYLWANLSRHDCAWADTYYQTLRQRGKSHACALRCLGQRWRENPLEDVANPNVPRCGVTSEEPAPAWFLGAQTAGLLTWTPHVNNFTKKSTCKPENISKLFLKWTVAAPGSAPVYVARGSRAPFQSRSSFDRPPGPGPPLVKCFFFHRCKL